jgi:hypothetical protein
LETVSKPADSPDRKVSFISRSCYRQKTQHQNGENHAAPLPPAQATSSQIAFFSMIETISSEHIFNKSQKLESL